MVTVRAGEGPVNRVWRQVSSCSLSLSLSHVRRHARHSPGYRMADELEDCSWGGVVRDEVTRAKLRFKSSWPSRGRHDQKGNSSPCQASALSLNGRRKLICEGETGRFLWSIERARGPVLRLRLLCNVPSSGASDTLLRLDDGVAAGARRAYINGHNNQLARTTTYIVS